MKVTVKEIHEMESTGAGFDMVVVSNDNGAVILSKANTYDRDLEGCKETHDERIVEYSTFEEFWKAGWDNAYKALRLATEEFQLAAAAALKQEQEKAAANGKTDLYASNGAYYTRRPNGRKWRLTEIIWD